MLCSLEHMILFDLFNAKLLYGEVPTGNPSSLELYRLYRHGYHETYMAIMERVVVLIVVGAPWK